MNASASTSALVRTLLRLAAPVALARLGIMGMGIADTIVVGQLAPADLAGLALGWAPTGVLLVTGVGLLLGVQVLAARAIGEGRPHDAGSVWRRGIVLGLVAGSVAAFGQWLATEPMLIAFGIEPGLAAESAAVARILALSLPLHFAWVASTFFLEAVQRPTAGTVVIWSANALNVALDIALVPEFGAVGAAWATVGSRLFMVAALTGWIAWSAAGRSHGVWTRTGGAPGYRALLGVGVASAVSQLAEAGAFSAMTVIAGRIGADAAAAYQILLNVLAVVFMVALGVAAATSVLVAEAWGGRDVRSAARAAWAGLAVNTAAMLLAAALLLLLPQQIARAFTSEATLLLTIATLMPLAALVVAPDGGQVVASSALRARGDNWFPTASHVLAYVVVMPPVGWLLGESMGRGVGGLMEAIAGASFLSIAVLLLRLRRLSSPQG